MFKIILDSTSDLSKDLRDKYDLDYCRMGVTVLDKEYYADLDYKEYSHKEFYDWMRNGARIYTSQVGDIEFKEVFSKYLKEGYDILYIACSSGLSASYNASLKVKEELLKEFTDRRIECFDSLISGFAQGSMGIKASLMQKEGKTLDEVLTYLYENRLRFNQFGLIDDLNYLKRAGRVKASKAFFGNLFGVKPIVISDVKGKNYAAYKAHGRKGSINETARLTVEAMEGDYNQVVYIAHADVEEDAKLLKQAIINLKPEIKNFYMGYLGPIIGASTGPGTIATYVFGKEVTLNEEVDN